MDNDKLARWFTFLEEECLTKDGLLCFYDFPKSQDVVYFSSVLAECLEFFLMEVMFPLG